MLADNPQAQGTNVFCGTALQKMPGRLNRFQHSGRSLLRVPNVSVAYRKGINHFAWRFFGGPSRLEKSLSR